MAAAAEFFETLPFSRFHRRLLMMGGLGYLFDALDVGIVAFILPVIVVAWSLTGAEAGVIASASSLGGIVGAIVAGYLADSFGRRKVIMGALAVYALATFGTAAATGWLSFLLPRVIAGAGTSAESVVIAPYLSEFASKTFRGRFVGGLTAFFSLGFLVAALIGYFIVPSQPQGWRVALVLAGLPIALLLWWRRRLPESPQWLEAMGRGAEAHEICALIEHEIFSAQGGVVSRASTVPSLNAFESAQKTAAAPVGGLKPLFGAALRKSTLVACVVWTVIGICYYAFLTWIPSLLLARGFTLTNSFAYSVAIFGASLPGYLSASFLNDLIGCRRVIVLYLAAGALAALGLASAEAALIIITMSVLLSFAMNGVYAGLYAYTPELFPSSSRGSGQGLATSLSRVGAMISPILVGILYPTVGFAGVFGAIVATLTLGLITVAVFGAPSGVPTKHPIALDDFHASPSPTNSATLRPTNLARSSKRGKP